MFCRYATLYRRLLMVLGSLLLLAALFALLRPPTSADEESAARTARAWVLRQERFVDAHVLSARCAAPLALRAGARTSCEVGLHLATKVEHVGVELVALDDRGATAFEYTRLDFDRADVESTVGGYLLQSVLAQIGTPPTESSLTVHCDGPARVTVRRTPPSSCEAVLKLDTATRTLRAEVTLDPDGSLSVSAS